jgi:uncharacterized protein (UPF0218 family)
MSGTDRAPTNWIAGNGEMVSIGDYVALELNRDSIGRIIAVADDHTGRPIVMLTEGKDAGSKVAIWPAQMLLKVLR